MGEEKMVTEMYLWSEYLSENEQGGFEEKSDGENEDSLKCEWERL